MYDQEVMKRVASNPRVRWLDAGCKVDLQRYTDVETACNCKLFKTMLSWAPRGTGSQHSTGT